jgi:hypothetical protein
VNRGGRPAFLTGMRNIESTLPKPWEVEATFQDSLYQWMERAPWLAISGAAHLLVFFLLMAIPWSELRPAKTSGVAANLEPPPEEFFEPEPDEPPEGTNSSSVESTAIGWSTPRGAGLIRRGFSLIVPRLAAGQCSLSTPIYERLG